MKISFNTHLTPPLELKGNNSNWRTFAYDDTVSKSRRKEIREHIFNEYLPNLKDEKDEFVRLTKIAEEIPKKPILNRDELYKYCEEFEQDCFRGAVTSNTFKYVKHAGIERVISLAPEDKYIEAAKEAGIEYHPCKIFVDNNILKNPLFMSEEYLENKGYEFYKRSKDAIKQEVIPFIQTMQKRNLYIGCGYGTYRTDRAVLFNSRFNPEADFNFIYINKQFILEAFENLYNKLTDEDKKALGFTEEFENNLKEAFKEQYSNF